VQRGLALALAEGIESLTGERSKIETVVVEPLQGRIKVEGLGIYARDSGAPILHARRVAARLEFEGLRPVLAQLRIEDPILMLHFDKGGLREFRNAKRSSSSGPRRTPWRRLRVQNATVILEHPEARLLAYGVDVTPSRDADTSRLDLRELVLRAGDIEQRSANVGLEGLRLGLDEILVPNFFVPFPLLSLHGRVALRPGEPVEASLNLFSELGAWNDHLGPDRSISGSLSLFVRVEGESRAPQVHGTFNLDPMAFTDKRRKPGYDTWEVEELEGASWSSTISRAAWGEAGSTGRAPSSPRAGNSSSPFTRGRRASNRR
jgi:hypothetical protein